MKSTRAVPYIVLAVICIAFCVVAWSGRFIQDDAYITLSYARNLVNGHGLVFNIGEHVEGFTSLSWTLVTAAMMSIGIRDVAQALQILGIACTALSLVPVYRIALRMLSYVRFKQKSEPNQKAGVDSTQEAIIAQRNAWLALAAPLFIAATAAVQYWSASAMEAPFFWLLTILTIEAFLAEPQSNRWVAIAMLALLTRPEAMLLVAVLLAARIIVAARTSEPLYRKPLTKQILMQGALLGGTLLALTAWRWFSYDALLPNTFAAKTGFLSDQLRAGVAYLYEHALNVWMVFALFAPFAVAYYVRNREVVLIAVLSALWIGAVVFLGGDVLRHERFLIPVQFLLATLLPAGWYLLLRGRMPLVAAAILIHSIGAFMMERDAITATSSIEQQLVMKMRRTGEWLKRSAVLNNRTYVVAATTIGALKYFSQQTVIDMLGLTDRTIATQPQIIPEVSNDSTVTWKERKYNAEYVLARKPDFIIFSTGIKPSAFAERALWAKQMYVDYYVFYYKTPRSPSLPMMFRRKPDEFLSESPQHRMTLTPKELEALLLFPQAVALVTAKPANTPSTPETNAEDLFRRMASEGPSNYGQPYQYLGDIAMQSNNIDSAVANYTRALAIDPFDIRSHYAMFQIRRMQQDTAGVELHGDWVRRFDPVLLTQAGIQVPEDVTYR